MGSTSSKPRGICVTLDAFGTLYHPREPIAVQYLKVAKRCGLKAQIKVPELASSFRRAFKDQSAKHPNYGKASGMKPETWWQDVVFATFMPLVQGYPLPAALAPRLYHHFSSSDAYTLYPDIEPFLQVMRQLRLKYHTSVDRYILLGVITNSDDRVKPILESLGLHVGVARHLEDSGIAARAVESIVRTHAAGEAINLDGHLLAFGDYYKPKDDINFIVTSYDSGHEKPNRMIFKHTVLLEGDVAISKWQNGQLPKRLTWHTFLPENMAAKSMTRRAWDTNTSRIHVGDDFEKDYQGASNFRKHPKTEALHLCRDVRPEELKSYQISSLSELATFVSMMAEINFKP